MLRILLTLAALMSVAVPIFRPEPATAGLIWDGSKGTNARSVFGIINCDAPGEISTVADSQRGQVWRFHKPASSNRCEGHGFKAGGKMHGSRNNATYYFGWYLKLSRTVDNNAVFQWKSYGNHVQNYPVVLKVIDGELTLLNRQPGNKVYLPWSRKIGAGTWNHIVLGIHTSDRLTSGWVEIYFNGQQQTFSNRLTRWPCRTWDSKNDPKWGIYGASGTTVDSFADDLRAGTTAADVMPPRPLPPRTPPPPATAKPRPHPTAIASAPASPAQAGEPSPTSPATSSAPGNVSPSGDAHVSAVRENKIIPLGTEQTASSNPALWIIGFGGFALILLVALGFVAYRGRS